MTPNLICSGFPGTRPHLQPLYNPFGIPHSSSQSCPPPPNSTPLPLASAVPEAASVSCGGREWGRASSRWAWGPRGWPPEPSTDPGNPGEPAQLGGDHEAAGGKAGPARSTLSGLGKEGDPPSMTPTPTGVGGGILPPATPPVSAWGELCSPAWLHLRSLPRKAFFKKERNWGEDMRDHPTHTAAAASHTPRA
ncbi:hypothetical protein P7K49_034460 [Saguinus oedipus]|uniref:Uncharacterized protein n=1 Tax=Saguinus oedipus TaxID=9490 RepID=A0ABQ9TVW8_SAGOE|nr:hypothetical protein P7K49_034460 [Saguinus oedipus]